MKTRVFMALALAAGAALAQEEARRDPAQPKAKVPPVQYRSAFADYRPFREPEPGDWRAVNEQMKALGGHTGHVARGKPAAKPDAGQGRRPK